MPFSPPPRVIRSFRNISGLIMDVDGVLTNGLVFYGPGDEEIKTFSLHDGHGLVLLRRAGIRLALLSGRNSAAIRRRASELGISEASLGVREKLPEFQRIVSAWNMTPDRVLFMGDDVVDLSCMKASGLSVTVPDAPWEVRREADWVTRKNGGYGAVREVSDWILLGRTSSVSVSSCHQGGDNP